MSVRVEAGDCLEIIPQLVGEGIEREPQYLSDIRERIAFYEGDGCHSIAAKARNRQSREAVGTLL